MVEQLNADNFSEKIKEGKVAVDFWAPWCMPCRMMAPEFEAAAAEAGDVKFYKLNTEDYPQVAGEYGIRGIPTVIFFRDGKIVHQFSGAMPKQMILEHVKEAFK